MRDFDLCSAVGHVVENVGRKAAQLVPGHRRRTLQLRRIVERPLVEPRRGKARDLREHPVLRREKSHLVSAPLKAVE